MRTIIMAALVTLAASAAPVMAQNEQTGRGTLLSINAQGKSEAPPDMAVVNIGVVTTGATAQEALAENNRRMAALTEALRRRGLEERDIQTSRVSIRPQYRDVDDRTEDVITAYEARNSVRARVRNLERTGRIIEAAVAAGGNSLNGVFFAHHDPQAQLDQARRDAIAEARRRAELYANALGMRVQHVVSVTEAGAARPGSEQLELTATLTTDSLLNELPQIIAAVVPVAPGEIETSASVSVTYELR
jgi:hypothetical protein